jgi:hypothetical protein
VQIHTPPKPYSPRLACLFTKEPPNADSTEQTLAPDDAGNEPLAGTSSFSIQDMKSTELDVADSSTWRSAKSISSVGVNVSLMSEGFNATY